MILAEQFLEPARELGFRIWSGVPCSYLKPLINYVIDDENLIYVSSANEGDAVATASGAALAGERSVAIMQNSGFGNAISPLTSLNWVFRLPVLLIITLRGDPGLKDEPQHELMGRVTTSLLETLNISWRWFPTDAQQLAPALETATRHMDGTGLPYALVMRKGTVADHALRSVTGTPIRLDPSALTDKESPELPSRRSVLAEVVHNTPVQDSIVIGSTGYNGRELFAIEDRPNQLYMVGSMGCAPSFSLGVSLARPELKMVVCDGDGGTLMRMGNMASVAAYAGTQFHHLVLDNAAHESTGGQATVSHQVDFSGIARACAYRRCEPFTGLESIRPFLNAYNGPAFMHIRTRMGVTENLPRPDLSPAQVKHRLMRHFDFNSPWAEAGA